VLIQTLKDRQQKLKANNTEFARRLGISRPLWVAVQAGRRAVGVELLRGVVNVFPDLDDEVLAFLRQRNDREKEGEGDDVE